jgi:hypothetical protein
MMTVQHIAAIYFSGKLDAARKRIQRLKATGYIDERPRRAYEPAILFMTKKAFATLQSCGLLESYPQVGWTALEKRVRVSQSTIQHEIEVLDVRAALTMAICRIPTQRIAEFRTWPALYHFTARREDVPGAAEVLMKPDGFIQIAERKDDAVFEHTFFLEVDRSTETQDTLAEKGVCYVNYYKSGGYAEWLGKPRAAFRDYPFCVLMVLKNAERRNNTAERLLQLNPPIYRQVWLTTSKEIISDPLGAIWVQPREYLEVTKGTAFDPMTQRQKGVYRRQTERERSVEKVICKRELIAME